MTMVCMIISAITLIVVLAMRTEMNDELDIIDKEYETLNDDIDLMLNEIEEIKSMLKEIIAEVSDHRPPIANDEGIVLSKQELEVLEGLANILNFDGTLPPRGGIGNAD